MGIDIYAKWNGQTEAEANAQITGFSTVAGKVGYLREAYHGEPYVTHYLLAEAFKTGEAKIPASRLKRRLPKAIKLAIEREKEVYQVRLSDAEIAKSETVRSFTEFVELITQLEKDGKEPVIIASY